MRSSRKGNLRFTLSHFVRQVGILVLISTGASFAWGTGSGGDCRLALELPEAGEVSTGWSLEFPNFFLSEKFRRLNPADLTKLQGDEKRALDREVVAIQSLLDRAVGKLLESIVVPSLDEDGQIQFILLFDRIRTVVKEVSSRSEVYVSGGVVRSILGLIYDLAYRRSFEGGETHMSVLLNEIILGTHSIFDKNGWIAAHEVRGVGSDFDLLIDAPSLEVFLESQEAAALVFESVRKAFSRGAMEAKLEKAVLTVADIRSLHSHPKGDGVVEVQGQWKRAIDQGGATIDFLLYSLKRKKLVSPSEHPNVVVDFIMGTYEYVESRVERENFDDTVFRGPRALVESPQLKIKDEGVLVREIQEIIWKVSVDGESVSDKALGQIGKMTRNARFSGGNNRVARASSRSALGQYRHLLEILSERQTMPDGTKIEVPLYVRRFALGRSSRVLPPEFEDLIMSADDFREGYLTDQTLYHGTPDNEWAMAILRGGFRVTMYEEGLRRGAYFSASANYSEIFRGKATVDTNFGAVFSLKVKSDVPLRVMDLRKPRAFGEERALERLRRFLEKGGDGRHAADILAEDYGVDVIILSEKELLIKNLGVLEEIRIGDFIRSFYLSIEKNQEVGTRWIDSYLTYRDLRPLGVALGQKDLQPVPSVRDAVGWLRRGLQKVSVAERGRVSQFLETLHLVSDEEFSRGEKGELFEWVIDRLEIDSFLRVFNSYRLVDSFDVFPQDLLKQKVRQLVEESVRSERDTNKLLRIVVGLREVGYSEELTSLIRRRITVDQLVDTFFDPDDDWLKFIANDHYRELLALWGSEAFVQIASEIASRAFAVPDSEEFRKIKALYYVSLFEPSVLGDANHARIGEALQEKALQRIDLVFWYSIFEYDVFLEQLVFRLSDDQVFEIVRNAYSEYDDSITLSSSFSRALVLASSWPRDIVRIVPELIRRGQINSTWEGDILKHADYVSR